MSKKILVVDDEQSITLALKDIFVSKGYEVLVAFTGEEAMKVLAQDKFDLVLLDIQMPGINGIELLKHAKKKYPKVKTVVLTGYLEKYKEEIEKIGCNAILNKPFSIKTLVGLLESTLSEKEGIKEDISGLIEDPKISGKAKLLFIEPNAIMYSSKFSYFKDIKRCKGEYQLEAAFSEEDIIRQLERFKPEIVLSNVGMFRLYRVSDKIARSSTPPKDVILYGIWGEKDLDKTKDVSFVGGLFDPITAAVVPKEMDKLGRIVRATAISHGLYIKT